MKSSTPNPSLWSNLNDNFKNNAREWFIHRAEKVGIPWKQSSSSFSESHTFQMLQTWKRRIENTSIVYPDYFLKPFHGYEYGNMEWKAAFENEAATYSISANYWKYVPYKRAEQWMRNNASHAIHKYCVEQHVDREKIYNIVDIGCSVGISTEHLAKAFPKANVWGLDLSPYFLSVAQYRAEEKGSGIQYVHANAEEIPMREDKIDMVAVNFMLHEVPYSARTNILQELYRILKPGGLLAILDLDRSRIAGHLAYNPFRQWAFEITEPHIQDYYTYSISESMYNAGFEHIQKTKNDPVNTLWIGQKSALQIHPFSYELCWKCNSKKLDRLKI